MYFFLQHLCRSLKIWKVVKFHFRIVLKTVYIACEQALPLKMTRSRNRRAWKLVKRRRACSDLTRFSVFYVQNLNVNC